MDVISVFETVALDTEVQTLTEGSKLFLFPYEMDLYLL